MDIDVFCSKVGVEKDLLLGRSRPQWLNNIRQVYCYVCVEHYNMTLEQTGKNINRHYSTVIHSVNRVKDLLSVKDKYILVIFYFLDIKLDNN